MTRAWVLVPLALLGALACEGREVLVFDLPGGGPAANAGVAPFAGSGGSAGSSVAAPPLGGSSAGAGGSTTGGSESGAGGTSGAAAGYGSYTAGTGGSAPRPCMENLDCDPGWACERQGCDLPAGECVPFDAFCSPDPKPVCGCNGVTYWNDCLRINAGVPLAGPGQCKANACSCEVGSDCAVPNASCSHLLPPGEMCGHGMGACWVLPAGCPPSADTKMFRECKPPDQGPAGPCLSGCKAIASEHSYAELRHGETCN